MNLPDVNVCLAAFRADHPEHLRCRKWILQELNSGHLLGMCPQVLAAVVRISTQASFMGGLPSVVEEALLFGDRLLDHPAVHRLQPGRGHWSLFASLCRSAQAKGKLAADAWFAALAMEHQATWISLDKDFARFPGLKWRQP